MSYQPYTITGAQRPGRILCLCDHATNFIPDNVNNGDLGLPEADMDRHIAYDIGAAGVTLALADLLDAPTIQSNFSRLVIDPNRGEDDPTLLMRLYDGTIIPANRDADQAEKARRLNAFHRPYHGALDDLVATRDRPILISTHSFTPRLNGRHPRPWHIGLLYAPGDDRLAQPLLSLLRAEPDLCVGENQPYAGHLPGDTIDRHALQHGHANILIELRHDLISTKEQQHTWAGRLAPLIMQAIKDAAV